MSYPSLEQYQEALQHPKTALLDPTLLSGKLSTSGLGLPLVMCGGFALTYTVATGSKKYAVRCFHKQSPDLEKRYQAISAKLTSLNSAYFLPFEFQAQGVRVAGNLYPVVKMLWANGDTLGDFVSANYRNSSALSSLRASLVSLASYMELQQIAHGDIQPGNLMIAGRSSSIQVIDYDGMFVPAINNLGPAESGHRNFQHPQRKAQFGPTLDRFSLIMMDVALRTVESDSKLWDETQSDADAFLFRASDFSDPGGSAVFQKLMSHKVVGSHARALAAVCMSDFARTPTLADFLAGKGVPQQNINIRTAPVVPAHYASQYLVIAADNYALFQRNIGSVVELIGQVTEVNRGFSKHGRGAYMFVNFGSWRGNIVSLTVWSATLDKVKDQVSASLVGSWVSVVGLVEPAYVSKKFKYSHISIDITGASQVRVISQAEAAFRLGAGQRSTSTAADRNRAIVENIRGNATAPVHTHVPTRSSAVPLSSNAAILQHIHRTQGQSVAQPSSSPMASATTAKSSAKPLWRRIPWWAWVAVAVALRYIWVHS